MRDKLTLFQTDYLISWDFSDKDLPVVVLCRMRQDGANVTADYIGRSHESAGCFSLRQVLEDYEARQREEEKRADAQKELLKKFADNLETNNEKGEQNETV